MIGGGGTRKLKHDFDGAGDEGIGVDGDLMFTTGCDEGQAGTLVVTGKSATGLHRRRFWGLAAGFHESALRCLYK